ncbi:hypothetical protein LCGC14_2252660 [marine sediment metagenome]|uniref:Uncharacterized protein n=1 Tax=marine sediment metagenome TaxID=412755 RepID=A0A0F9DPI3_9ZZZZ
MLASEYIARYVHPDYQSYARVVVSYARKNIHVPLRPDQPVPDNDPGGQRGDNVTAFIEMDTDAMPPVLIRDHNCKGGFVCTDHPDEPAGHNECYSKVIRCEYPHCTVEADVEVLLDGQRR